MSSDRNDLRKKNSLKNDESTNNVNSNGDGNDSELMSPQFQRHLKIVSILMFFFAALIFFALISYTPKDEVNTELSFNELKGLFTGDDALRAKAETTHNWLGLLGAILSNALYNYTIGYAILLLPFFIAYWAKFLFKNFSIPEELIKRTIVYLILGTLFAATAATFTNIQYMPDLSKEWFGAIGQFLYNISSSLIGTGGAFFLFLMLAVIVIIRGTSVNIDSVLYKIRDYFYSLFDKTKNYKSKLNTIIDKTPPKETTVQQKPQEKTNFGGFNILKKQEIENNDDDSVSDTPKTDGTFRVVPNEEKTEEPARIFRKSLNINISNPASMNKDEFMNHDKFSHRNPFSSFEKKRADADIHDNTADDSLLPNEDVLQKEILNKPDDLTVVGKQTAKLSAMEETFENDDTDLPESDNDLSETHTDLPESDNDLSEEKTVPEAVIAADTTTSNDTETENRTFNTNINRITKTIQDDEELEKVDTLDEDTLNNDLQITNSQRELNLNINKRAISKEKPDISNPLCAIIHEEDLNYFSPTLDLLDPDSGEYEINEEELQMNARLLQEKLETFKIFIEDLNITPGPVVTQYEFVPAPGIKISKIEGLADDIEMALKAKGIRIIAPVPGKGTVGIEIPNQEPNTVSFSSIINSKAFYESKLKLPLALGKTISGEIFCADLAKMPHLLIAGSTGAGKSVGINTLVCSLLYKMPPQKLKFVFIDPKKVELQLYGKLENHFLAVSPDVQDLIITSPEEAVITLKAVCAEMDLRYDILSKVGQRNIEDYNRKIRKGKLTTEGNILHGEMPYIVVVIDELADLMLTASKEVELPLIRIAQLARAVGIHLVVATQRPSVNVITGIIKANFPARIAYLTASKIDSRTILDISGAESLLGKGDMLFLPNGSPKPIRVQNAFISTDEVENICEHIGKQEGYSQPYLLPSLAEKDHDGGGISKEDRDPLFEDAARLIIQQQQGSVSLVQRRLKVGYARAGRIIDELEDAGVVGPYDGSKARKVYMESEMELEAIL